VGQPPLCFRVFRLNPSCVDEVAHEDWYAFACHHGERSEHEWKDRLSRIVSQVEPSLPVRIGYRQPPPTAQEAP
jgi:hypothetical protein